MTSRSDLYPLQYGANNPILRTKTTPVDHHNPHVQEVAQALSHLIHEYSGVGLAAPQIGQDMRIIAVTQRDKKGEKMTTEEALIMLNPRIIDHSKETTIQEEGCLSLPNRYGDVERFQTIHVTYTTPTGKKVINQRHGFTSVIIQHEVDHLDGILFIDKLAVQAS